MSSLEDRLKFLVDIKKGLELLSDLNSKIEDDFSLTLQKNEELSQEVCEELIRVIPDRLPTLEFETISQGKDQSEEYFTKIDGPKST